jgi:hypothetical protein
VSKQNTNIVPRNNSTWLDYPRDDFERGRRESYDLNLNGVSELSDITHVYLSKTGDDAWCLRSLALKVNNQLVYDQSFASERGGCRWLDDDDGHKLQFAVSHAGLRDHSAWGRYDHTAALLALGLQGIPNAELVSRFEGIVGDTINGNEAYWGKISGAAVEVTRGCPASQATCQKLHVDLDLAASVPGPNPEVDIDFDVDVACKDGDLNIHTDNFKVNADSSVLWELTSLGLIELLDNRIDEEVRHGFEAIDRSIKDVGSCRAFVDGNAGVRVEQVRVATGMIPLPAARR